MSSDLSLLEIREEQRQKHRKRRQDKKSHHRVSGTAEANKHRKPPRYGLASDPLDDYFEYYLPSQSRGSGRVKPHKRRLGILESE